MMHYNLTLDVDKYYANAQHLIVKINDQICSEFKGDDARLILGIITGGIQPTDMTNEMSRSLDNLYHGTRNGLLATEEVKQKKTFDAVKGPDHYLQGRNYEPRKVIDDWGLGFYLGNTVKYISRAGRKGSRLEDLKKARQYLDWEIEKEEMKS